MSVADVRKDVRALAPTWLSAALVLIANVVVWTPWQFRGAILAYAFGTIALGAQAIGHEYTHRTLPLLLSQPRDRRRVLATKLAVLAVMIGALAAVAVFVPAPAEVVVTDRGSLVPADLTWHDWPLLAWIAAVGMCLAPCLSVLCRGTLPAIVFTVTVPGTLAVTAEILGIAQYGVHDNGAVEAFKSSLVSWILAAACAAGAVLTWILFVRLQVVEGSGRALELPVPRGGRVTRSDTGVPRRPHPIAALLRKELRLQQMTFVVAAVCVTAWVGFALAQQYVVDAPVPLGALTTLYSALLAILIGSLASAEERQLGTWQWQVLLPVPLWKQWAVKAGTVLGLTLVFGLSFPVFLHYVFPAGAELPGRWPGFAYAMLALATVSLYVSSLSGSGVRALVVSLPVVAVIFIVVMWAGGSVYPAAIRMFAAAWGRTFQRVTPAQVAAAQSVMQWIWAAVCLGFLAFVLRCGLDNYRSADRRIVRIAGHAVGSVMLLLLGVVVPAAVWAYFVGR